MRTKMRYHLELHCQISQNVSDVTFYRLINTKMFEKYIHMFVTVLSAKMSTQSEPELRSIVDFTGIILELDKTLHEQMERTGEPIDPYERLEYELAKQSLIAEFRELYEILTPAAAAPAPNDFSDDKGVNIEVNSKQHNLLVYMFNQLVKTDWRPTFFDVQLQTDKPSSIPPNLDDKLQSGQRLTQLLYTRNDIWLKRFATSVDSVDTFLENPDRFQQHLWLAYSNKLKSLTDKTGSNNKKPSERYHGVGNIGDVLINSIDALFKPIEMVEYAPEEVILIVQTEKVLQAYKDYVQRQINLFQNKQHEIEVSHQAEVTRQKILLSKLHDHRTGKIMRDTNNERYKQLVLELNNVIQHEAELTNTMTNKEKRANLPTDSRMYRNFLLNMYVDRETMFLKFLNKILTQRRDNKYLMNRMENAAAYRSNQHIRGDKAQFRRYLKARDQMIAEILPLERPKATNSN